MSTQENPHHRRPPAGARAREGSHGDAPALQAPPHPTLHDYYETSSSRQRFLNDLFDRTAHRYRTVDRVTGLGSGLWYRRKALRDAGLGPGMTVLDVGCGPGLTAQGALDLVGSAGSVTGIDPSTGMLHEARKGPCRRLVQGVGEQLPFLDASFDFLSMGYALRHVSDLRAAFREYRRVLKPGGIVLLLEISRPRSAVLLSVSRFYIKTVLGAVFAAATGNRDMRTLMRYWWDTTESCVAPEAILSALDDVGFVQCDLRERFSGLLRDYRAVKA
ncbi:MAG TPA: class I SAM-dependent methyltransferase [Methylomirabilota bacterium]|jgi:demethylmenaquinone methyltransferase/2-methoxy-6-polyprenyl-1,4-benzoquinol methylase|nr:class I SAM-dependent methyltransferase [Methylomirabilota bacterium]